MSAKLLKINTYGFSQGRNIFLTNKALYNFKHKSIFLLITRFQTKNYILSYNRNNSFQIK